MRVAKRISVSAICLALVVVSLGVHVVGASAGTLVQSGPEKVPSLTWDALANAEYIFDLGEARTVKLVDGKYEENTGPGATEVFTAEMSPVYALGDLNGDGVADGVAIISYNTGGTGVFFDLEAVLNENGRAVPVAGAPLRDRMILRTLGIASGKIMLDMVQAGPSEPACCPTEEVLRVYNLKGKDLVQASETQVSKEKPKLPFPAWNALASLDYGSKYAQDGRVQLKDGSYDQADTGSTPPLKISLYRSYATGDLTGGGLPDAAVLLVSQSGEKPEAYELAVVLNENGRLIQTGTIPLGEGVLVQGLAIASGQVIVNLLTPGPGDQACCPTRKVVRTYQVKGGKLIPVAPEAAPSAAPGTK
jgi:hypothetical protein